MIDNQMSRRHFLATTGAMAGTALFHPIANMKVEAAETIYAERKRLRVALVRKSRNLYVGAGYSRKLF